MIHTLNYKINFKNKTNYISEIINEYKSMIKIKHFSFKILWLIIFFIYFINLFIFNTNEYIVKLEN